MTKTEAKPAIAAVNELFAKSSDGLREIVRAVMQEVLEAEMTDALQPRRANARPLGSATDPAIMRAPSSPGWASSSSACRRIGTLGRGVNTVTSGTLHLGDDAGWLRRTWVSPTWVAKDGCARRIGSITGGSLTALSPRKKSPARANSEAGQERRAWGWGARNQARPASLTRRAPHCSVTPRQGEFANFQGGQPL